MSDRFYKIGNTWYPWQTAHGLYGYTKTPTIRITYISTSQATWGQPESGYGFFDGDASEPQDGSYFHTSTWGWFDADSMAKTIWLMPSECEIDDIFFENDGDISPGARLIIDPNVSIDEEDWRYLIASVRNLGWHTLDEWEELGWVLSDPNTLYFGGDFSGNNIRMESVDGGGGLIEKYASYKTLFELRGWEPGGLFIDKPRMMGICGVLTETSDSVVQVEIPKQLSVGRIEFIGSLAEGGIPESGVVEEYVPAPALPTVETNLGAYGTLRSGTKSLAPNDIGVLYLRNEATTAVIYDDNYLYSVYRYYYDVLGASEWRIGAFFEAVKDGAALAAKNITNSTISYIGLYSYATCSDTQAEVVTVYNSSDEAFNAFKYTLNGTDYYYVLDNTQTDWTDDLSSIGYHLPPATLTAYPLQNKTATRINRYTGYSPLYDEQGNQIQTDDSMKYSISVYYSSSDGPALTPDGLFITTQNGILKIFYYVAGGDGVDVQRVEYTMSSKPATTCFFNQNGSKANISLSYLSQYYLYLNNGDMIPYSSSVSLLGVYAADGTQVSGTFELINGFNPSGYLAIRCTSGNVTAAYCEISIGS